MKSEQVMVIIMLCNYACNYATRSKLSSFKLRTTWSINIKLIAPPSGLCSWKRNWYLNGLLGRNGFLDEPLRPHFFWAGMDGAGMVGTGLTCNPVVEHEYVKYLINVAYTNQL